MSVDAGIYIFTSNPSGMNQGKPLSEVILTHSRK
jgi:hypothetical protein